MTIPPIFDTKALSDEIFHYVLVPVGAFLASRSWRAIDAKAKRYADEAVAQALKAEKIAETIKPVITTVFTERTPTLKDMMDRSNDDLLQKINGTYVRAREHQIWTSNLTDRLERMERKLDTKT